MADTASPTQPQPASQPAAASQQPKKKNNTLLILLIVFIVLLLPCCACTALVVIGGTSFSDAMREAINENVSEDLFENAVEESLDSADDDTDVDIDDDQITWDTDDGSGSMGSTTEWPDSAPNEVPEFTYATIDFAYSSSNAEEGGGWSMSFVDAEESAVASYTADLEAAGWTITSTAEYSGTTTVIAERGPLSVVCTCSSSDDTCSLAITEDVE